MKTRMRTKKKTRKGTIGSNLQSRSHLIAAAAVLALLCPLALPARKDKQKEAPAPFAVIAGTVYRPPGFALPGVQVRIVPEQADSGGVKLKKAEAVTNTRGEFALRVPPVPAKWRVDVQSSGYKPDQRSVSVEGEQRFDLSIVLEPSRPLKETQ